MADSGVTRFQYSASWIQRGRRDRHYDLVVSDLSLNGMSKRKKGKTGIPNGLVRVDLSLSPISLYPACTVIFICDHWQYEWALLNQIPIRIKYSIFSNVD